MAVKYPAANGNWSTAANWNDGTLPATGDIVCANGKTVTIDMDLAAYTFDRLTTVATSPAAGGGRFTCAIACTINADLITGTSQLLLLSHTVGNTVYINGNSIGGNAIVCINNSSTGALTITGNVSAGFNTGYGIYNGSTGALTITGNVTGGAAGGGVIGIYNASNASITITGNVSSGTGGTAHGIYNGSTGAITITGNVTGGSSSNAYGINNLSTSVINVVGVVISGSASPGIYSTANCSVYINGIITTQTPPTAVVAAVTLTTGTLYFSGTIINQSSQLAVTVKSMVLLSTGSQTWTFVDDAASTKNLYSADIPALGNPDVADVRLGTTFGPASELTGTMAVPTADKVLLGVPNDKTTGTLVMTPAGFWGALRSSLTTANSIGAYLKNAATVDSVGDQITHLT